MPERTAAISTILAAEHISSRLDQVCRGFNLTRQQYNILRLLQARHPDGYSTVELANRVLNRSPDMTRRLDLLQKRGLVQRKRNHDDHRLVRAYITPEGLDLLDRVTPVYNRETRKLFTHLTEEEVAQLVALLPRIYSSTPLVQAHQALAQAILPVEEDPVEESLHDADTAAD